MIIEKTTVYKLNTEEIREVCYSLFVHKLKKLNINSNFEISDIKLNDFDDYEINYISAELNITENEIV